MGERLSEARRLRPGKQFLIAALAGLALRSYLIWRFPSVAGDTKIYEELAGNWLDHGVYGLVLDGRLTPVDLRVPGYPLFLAAIFASLGRARLPVMCVQALVDILTCFLAAALATRVSSDSSRRTLQSPTSVMTNASRSRRDGSPRLPAGADPSRRGLAAMWLAALCPFTANYTTVPLTEVLAGFLTTAALLVLVIAYIEESDDLLNAKSHSPKLSNWFFGGLAVGIGTLVRPETPLVLVPVALGLCARWRRPTNWARLTRTALLLIAGFVLPLMPWAVRNWRTFHKLQFLAPRYTELPGEFVPRGFYAWTNTWLVRFRDVYLVLWKLDEEPILIESMPAYAFDSPEERSHVTKLLERYNETFTITPEIDTEFQRLASERSIRHPLRTYVSVPMERAAAMWFTPRTELLPFSGDLWPPGMKWQEDPIDFSVTLGLGLLNITYVGLALFGVWRNRWNSGVMLLLAFIVVRTAFLTRIETPEPRYVLICFPTISALAALAWTKTVTVRKIVHSTPVDRS